MNVSLFGSDGTPGLLKRVLGPSADKIGEALARWVDFRTENVGRILDNANRKLGDRAADPGQVPPRVAGRLLDEGSYCDDDVMVEYLGGVLASARSGVDRDDRGARWTTMVTSLSTYDIRLHYVLYASLRLMILGGPAAPTNWASRSDYPNDEVAGCMFWTDLSRAMDFGGGEDGPEIVSQSMFALAREGLIEASWSVFTAGQFSRVHRKVGHDSGSVWAGPSPVGIQLWMWAHGLGDVWRNWTSLNLEIPPFEVAITPAKRLKDLPDAEPVADGP